MKAVPQTIVVARGGQARYAGSENYLNQENKGHWLFWCLSLGATSG